MAHTITTDDLGNVTRKDYPGMSIVNVVSALTKETGYVYAQRDGNDYVVVGPYGEDIRVNIDEIA